MSRRLNARRPARELDPRVAWLLMMLYPRAWRERYGAEVLRLTRELIARGETTPVRATINLACTAVAERCRMLGNSWRPAMTAAATAMVAVVGGLLLVGHASPARVALPARPVSAAPAPLRVSGLICAYRMTATVKLTPSPHDVAVVGLVAGQVVTYTPPAGAKPLAGHSVFVWVTVGRSGQAGGNQCVVRMSDKTAASGP